MFLNSYMLTMKIRSYIFYIFQNFVKKFKAVLVFDKNFTFKLNKLNFMLVCATTCFIIKLLT